MPPDQDREIQRFFVVPKNRFEAVRVTCYSIAAKKEDSKAKDDKLQIDWKLRHDTVDFNLADSAHTIKPTNYSELFNLSHDVPDRFDKFGINRSRVLSIFYIGQAGSDKAIKTD